MMSRSLTIVCALLVIGTVVPPRYSSGATGAIAGTITDVGTITDAGTAAGIGDVEVQIFDELGDWVTSATSDVHGDYTSPQLEVGTYFLHTTNSSGYINEIYDDLPCLIFENCGITSGTPVHVSAPVGATGIDFALDPGGRIAGVITDQSSSAGIEGAHAEIYNEFGSYVTKGIADATGAYISKAGLPGGTYYARSATSAGYFNHIYDNFSCELPYSTGCHVDTGSPISVTVASTTNGIDFDLSSGGRISGIITDGETGLGIEGVVVQIYTEYGTHLIDEASDTSGAYISGPGLPAGTYHLRTTNSAGYFNEVFDDQPCGITSCYISSGTDVVVEIGQTTDGIDFGLELGGRIAGRVISSASGAAVSNARVWVYDELGDWIGSTHSDATGAYLCCGGLAGGAVYYVEVYASFFMAEVYDDLQCGPYACNITGGTGVWVNDGDLTSGIDLALDPAAEVIGTITDSLTGDGVSDVSVNFRFTNDNQTYTAWYTGSEGTYSSQNLPLGLYRVYTFDASDTHIDEVYLDVPCLAGCPLADGTLFNVSTSGQHVLDFELDPGGYISGTVTDALTGAPIDDAVVKFYDPSGTFVSNAGVTADGSYKSSALPPNTYYVITTSFAAYQDELYDDLPCDSGCDVTSGAGVSVTVRETTAGIHFALFPDSLIFADGFESGSSSAWSSTAP